MSWSLEIYVGRDSQISRQALAARLAAIAPQLAVVVSSLNDTSDGWESLLLSQSDTLLQATISYLDLRAEYESDHKLFTLLRREIVEAGADSGDAAYSMRLTSLLDEARQHYVVTSAHPDSFEQRRVVILVAYTLSLLTGGLIHDMQTGAWMDPELFEGLLDAYGASDYLA